MTMDMTLSELSRRERQVMNVLFARGPASVGDILDGLEDPPSYSAVRATLRVLEQKGHVEHLQDGPRYLYRPTVRRETARSAALRHLVRTFFDGSVESAAAALVQMSDTLTNEERARITEAIEQAREDEDATRTGAVGDGGPEGTKGMGRNG